jgi:hypothetical protein
VIALARAARALRCPRRRLAVVASLAGCAGLVTGAAAAGSSLPRCTALVLRAGPAVVAKPGQLPILFELVDRGRSACSLDGYPRIELRGSAGTLYRFAYRDGGDAEVTSRRPAVVTLHAGSGAWILINKAACVGNVNGRLASVISVVAPGSSRTLTTRFGGNVRYPDYCGSGDPGHQVDVSPVEPTIAATRSI